MPVIVREGSWRVWIYTNDHAPPHVHVNRYAGALKVQLPTEFEPARILARRGLNDREAIAALRPGRAARGRTHTSVESDPWNFAG